MWDQSEPIVDGIVELARAKGVSSGKVLDICCGNGRIAIPLAKRGLDVVGTDISKVLIEDAETKAQEYCVKNRAKFIAVDVRDELRVWLQAERFHKIISAISLSLKEHQPRE